MSEVDGWSGKVRMLPVNGGPAKGSAGSPEVSQRRYYEASPGGWIDAPANDVSELTNQRSFCPTCDGCGATAVRPNNAYLRPGWTFIDTDLSIVVAWDGAQWRNVITGEVA